MSDLQVKSQLADLLAYVCKTFNVHEDLNLVLRVARIIESIKD